MIDHLDKHHYVDPAELDGTKNKILYKKHTDRLSLARNKKKMEEAAK